MSSLEAAQQVHNGSRIVSRKMQADQNVGCVLASRLSHYLPESSILVIEAGLEQDPRVKPTLGLVGQPAKEIKWVFPSAPQKAIGDKTTDFTQGKILGGTSSINHQVWSRGAYGDLYVSFGKPPYLFCSLCRVNALTDLSYSDK